MKICKTEYQYFTAIISILLIFIILISLSAVFVSCNNTPNLYSTKQIEGKTGVFLGNIDDREYYLFVDDSKIQHMAYRFYRYSDNSLSVYREFVYNRDFDIKYIDATNVLRSFYLLYRTGELTYECVDILFQRFSTWKSNNPSQLDLSTTEILTQEVLSEATLAELRKEFATFYGASYTDIIDNCPFDMVPFVYLGTVNNKTVYRYYSQGVTTDYSWFIVGDGIVLEERPYETIVFYNGVCYDIETAFNNGIVTRTELIAIAQAYWQSHGTTLSDAIVERCTQTVLPKDYFDNL